MQTVGMAFKEELMQGQNAKVRARQEEMKKIKKGIYQMQVMIDSQEMETFKEEWEKSEAKTEAAKTDTDNTDNADSTRSEGKQQGGKTDSKTEMERMMSLARNLQIGNA